MQTSQRARCFFTFTVAFALLLGPALEAQEEAAAKALFAAARSGNVQQVEELLAAGVDVQSKDRYGATALAMAATNAQQQVVKVLLSHGADPNSRETFYGSSALDRALFSNQNIEIAKLLLRAGAEDRDQALEYAVAQEDIGLVEAALAGGPITESRLAGLRAASETHTDEIKKLLATAKTRPNPEPPAYSLEELHDFTGIFEGFASATRAIVNLREGQLWLEIQPVEAAGETSAKPLDDGVEAKYETKGHALRAVQNKRFQSTMDPGISASFFGRAGTIEGIALSTHQQAPVSLRRSVAEPIGTAGFTPSDTKPTDANSVHWPSFRGTRASGVGDGAPLPTHWDLETGDGVAWMVDIEGLGNSSPIVWGHQIFITTAVAEGEQVPLRTGLTGEGTPVSEETPHSWRIVSYDKRTGAKLWQTEVAQDVPLTQRHFKATQANSTAATDGRHVVAVFPTAGIACLTMQGEVVWQRRLGGLNAGAFSDPGIEWGFASSPVIYEDLVILQVDIHDGPYLAAWEIETGELRWRVERDVAPSWATPTIAEGPLGAELVVNGSTIYAYDPTSGEQLWSLGPNSELVIATPVVGNEVVYVSAGYPPIKPIYAVALGQRGDLSDRAEAIAWQHNRGGAYMPTPLLYGGVLYFFHHNGIFVSYDAATGDPLAKSRFSQHGTFTASPVAANGNLYAPTEEGLLYVLAAEAQYNERAVHDFNEPLMATPAVSEGLLIVRTPSRLIALGNAPSAPNP